ncbi:PEPxxWA-CTERM sorting domain-containing protein [Sphingomonas glaciei]|uniref:PEPxxWA-CTERM sorting domain-containing protein n=1 Tax=Sphingomonas glaciei TaxID=2938948 RepID=A0ABY5MY22_9SPHN|nr:PEPxxWA-CTERM sorting domain-containing protein [Sphingomonas glaciei]UUR09350.1 PEPxxWA-CTERM sorting domain-containing protein [Sphingomonas glaciei]
MALLNARSPGEREQGALTQTKIKKRLAFVPRERALGKTFPPKPSPIEQLAEVVIPAPPTPLEIMPSVTPLVPPTAADVINAASLIASAPPFGGGSPIIGGGSPIIGGGGLLPPPPPSGSAPPTSEVPPGGTVASPVPEPGSWLTMLLGFGVVGASMRRRRSGARRLLQVG